MKVIMRMLITILLSLFLNQAISLDTDPSWGGKCPSAEFQCDNGRCISLAWKCDSQDDCHDNSDERDCEYPTCSDGFFRCDNGKCITQRWTCDGLNDCKDNSDENSQMCSNMKCEEGFIRCNNQSAKCISKDWRCDGEVNCPQGEDEAGCEHKCADDEFNCTNGKCISNEFKCDTKNDCGDSSDEDETLCAAVVCDQDHKQCNNGECVHDFWWCDGDKDCDDNSDEMNCTSNELPGGQCDKASFQCLSLDSDPCISKNWVCDGDKDCLDGSDEANCQSITCEPGEKLCPVSNYCLKETYFCDGEKDCVEGDDEVDCPERTCEKDHFSCQNGKCIKDDLLCNGMDDCGNGHDESPDICPPEEKNPCLKDNGGCAQICVPDVNNSLGRRCECNAGYKLMNNSAGDPGCEDEDECLKPGTCSQLCTNTKGSFKCECTSGFSLVDDRYCKAITRHDAKLVLSDRNELRRYDLIKAKYSLLVEDHTFSGSRAIDVDVRTGKVFWADMNGPGVIYMVDIKTQKRELLVQGELEDPEGMALDWVHKNLYIADKTKGVIQVVQIANKYRKTLLHNLTEPISVAADPAKGWIYWTNWGINPGIERSGMNGAQRSAVVSKDTSWPRGLTIDHFSRRLYWVDSKLHTISSAKLDGSDQTLVLHSVRSLPHPYGVALFEDDLFWTDIVADTVYKTRKFGNKNKVEELATGLKRPMAIQVMHESRQPYYPDLNRCENNGGCSHFCLPIPMMDDDEPKGAECACPDGQALDGKHICVDAKDLKPRVTKTPVILSVDTTENGSPNVPYSGVPDDTTNKLRPSVQSGSTELPNQGVNKEHKSSSNGEGQIALVAIGIVGVLGLMAVVIIVLLVRRHKKRNVRSMNFDNPVYRKTTTDEQLIVETAQPGLPQSMQPLNGDEVV